jgi:glycerol-3-phosphate O-acyltransferase
MSGGEKHREDATGLLKSTEVLRHRYGRIDVQFGQALTMRDVRSELKIDQEAELSPGRRRALVTRLANRAMDEINRVTAVTPGALTALALLTDRRRSISFWDLVDRAQKLLSVLSAMDARIPPLTGIAVGTEVRLRAESIREAIQIFEEAELIEAHTASSLEREDDRRETRGGDEMMYRVLEKKRLELDTSKNHIVHFFVERGLVAASMLYDGGGVVAHDVLRDRVQGLSRLFKHEFRFRADSRGFDAIFDRTLDTMVAAGEIARLPDKKLGPGEGHDGWPAHVWLDTYVAIARSFVEGYRVAARGLTLLLKGPMLEKDLVKRSLQLGDRMYLANEIELREAVSKPIVTNALVSFREDGYVHVKDGKHELTETFNSPEAVAAIEGRIAGFCVRTR